MSDFKEQPGEPHPEPTGDPDTLFAAFEADLTGDKPAKWKALEAEALFLDTQIEFADKLARFDSRVRHPSRRVPELSRHARVHVPMRIGRTATFDVYHRRAVPYVHYDRRAKLGHVVRKVLEPPCE